jgi:GT2 family glycosyltransferase
VLKKKWKNQNGTGNGENNMTDIAIIIYNELDYLKGCVDSLEKYTTDFHCILINNNSTEFGVEEFLDEYKEKDNFLVINNKYNLGFPLSLNQAILNMESNSGICFCNQDIYFTPGWLDKILKMANSNIEFGMIGPSTSYSKSKEQEIPDVVQRRMTMTHEEIVEYSKVVEEKYRGVRELTDVTGFCFYVKKEVIDKIGGFDWRSFGIGSGEEAHFRFRMGKGGYKAVVAKESYVHHYGHQSFDHYYPNSRRLWVQNNKKYSELISKITYDKNIYVPIEDKVKAKDLNWLH